MWGLNFILDHSGKIPALDKDSALLFCYFNHMGHFESYLEKFSGSCIILIGPVDGKRHCEPDPMYFQQFKTQWKLVDSHDIRGAGEDLICIYKKNI